MSKCQSTDSWKVRQCPSPLPSPFNRKLRWMSDPRPRLQSLHDLPQQRLNALGRLLETWIIDCLHGSDWIDGGDLRSIAPQFLDDDVAWQHGADLVLKLQ